MMRLFMDDGFRLKKETGLGIKKEANSLLSVSSSRQVILQKCVLLFELSPLDIGYFVFRSPQNIAPFH